MTRPDWPRLVRAVAFAVVLMAALYLPLRLFRYDTVMLAGQPFVLDRWRHELCAVSGSTPPRCFPLR